MTIVVIPAKAVKLSPTDPATILAAVPADGNVPDVIQIFPLYPGPSEVDDDGDG